MSRRCSSGTSTKSPVSGSRFWMSCEARTGELSMVRSGIVICDRGSVEHCCDDFRTLSNSRWKNRPSWYSPSCMRIEIRPPGNEGEANAAIQLTGCAGS